MASMVQQQTSAPPHMRAAVNFLRSSSAGMKIRVGVISGKRVDYFKGKSALKALLSPAYAKLSSAPKVTSEAEASALLTQLIPFAFFLRVERGAPSGPKSSSPKTLSIVPAQGTPVQPDEYFAWFYEGSQWTTYLGGAAMVAVMLAGVMFPLWPPIMRLGVWYLSMGVLGLIGLFFALAVVRLIFYVITVLVASPGIWIFPTLFADVGFFESFVPLWEWDLPKKKTGKKKRAGAEGEKVTKKGKRAVRAAESAAVDAGATIEEVVEEEAAPVVRRGAVTVEEVPDED